MPWLALRSDIILLRALVLGVGSCWSVAFIAIALGYQLQLYADGAMFSYAVAVGRRTSGRFTGTISLVACQSSS